MVIPTFNEELAIARTVATIPEWVDAVFVVDDASSDGTPEILAALHARRVTVVRHGINRGVGAAIVSGYQQALAKEHDVVVVMGGDGQMDPQDLCDLLAPIASGAADYSKGNRFRHPDIWRVMPRVRIVGNITLSCLTWLVSGYWHIFDSQCGYTAITKHAIKALDLRQIFPSYGYPNDLLARLALARARVVDVPVRPIYGLDWSSGITVLRTSFPLLGVLGRAWWRRFLAERVCWQNHGIEPILRAEEREREARRCVL